jgi:hypothetical protein
MRHLVYNVRHSVVSINFTPLNVTVHYLDITTLVSNDTEYSAPFHDAVTAFDFISAYLHR